MVKFKLNGMSWTENWLSINISKLSSVIIMYFYFKSKHVLYANLTFGTSCMFQTILGT
jgi:hypothetical protein